MRTQPLNEDIVEKKKKLKSFIRLERISRIMFGEEKRRRKNSKGNHPSIWATPRKVV
jgi:hypothetical protein